MSVANRSFTSPFSASEIVADPVYVYDAYSSIGESAIYNKSLADSSGSAIHHLRESFKSESDGFVYPVKDSTVYRTPIISKDKNVWSGTHDAQLVASSSLTSKYPPTYKTVTNTTSSFIKRKNYNNIGTTDFLNVGDYFYQPHLPDIYYREPWHVCQIGTRTEFVAVVPYSGSSVIGFDMIRTSSTDLTSASFNRYSVDLSNSVIDYNSSIEPKVTDWTIVNGSVICVLYYKQTNGLYVYRFCTYNIKTASKSSFIIHSAAQFYNCNLCVTDNRIFILINYKDGVTWQSKCYMRAIDESFSDLGTVQIRAYDLSSTANGCMGTILGHIALDTVLISVQLYNNSASRDTTLIAIRYGNFVKITNADTYPGRAGNWIQSCVFQNTAYIYGSTYVSSTGIASRSYTTSLSGSTLEYEEISSVISSYLPPEYSGLFGYQFSVNNSTLYAIGHGYSNTNNKLVLLQRVGTGWEFLGGVDLNLIGSYRPALSAGLSNAYEDTGYQTIYAVIIATSSGTTEYYYIMSASNTGNSSYAIAYILTNTTSNVQVVDKTSWGYQNGNYPNQMLVENYSHRTVKGTGSLENNYKHLIFDQDGHYLRTEVTSSESYIDKPNETHKTLNLGYNPNTP